MNKPGRILVVDDDVAVGTVVTALLEQEGFETRFATSAASALEMLGEHAFDAMISDVRMPGMDGMALLEQVMAKHPEVSVILMTAHGTISMAVQAMKAGARDFVTKPFEREELLFVVHKELERARDVAGEVTAPLATGGHLVGDAPLFRDALKIAGKVAATSTTVVLRGESGTGKGQVARRIHDLSDRRHGPFITVNCGALPDALLESELFGHEKGAFTGAAIKKPGRVELAQGGTLFFDEIGDTTPAMQVKLLRLLQDRQYERLGGTAPLSCDVRFIAATHRPLEEMVKAGTFREDLFYRLNVVPLWLPALRDRAGDIPLLIEAFAMAFAAEQGRRPIVISPAVIERLATEPWPGNLRQLKNLVERLAILSDDGTVSLSDLDAALAGPRGLASSAVVGQPTSSAGFTPEPTKATGSLGDRRRETEKAALMDALGKAQGNRSLAAKLLGVSRRTLYNKLEELFPEKAPA